MKTILVVDDEQTILDITSAILEKFKYTPLTASTADKGAKLIEEGGIDLALVDVVLPGRGGLDLLMEIKDKHPQLPVIIMTGKIKVHNDPFTNLTTQFGAKAVLPKPFTPDELLKVVQSVLGKG